MHVDLVEASALVASTLADAVPPNGPLATTLILLQQFTVMISSSICRVPDEDTVLRSWSTVSVVTDTPGIVSVKLTAPNPTPIVEFCTGDPEFVAATAIDVAGRAT